MIRLGSESESILIRVRRPQAGVRMSCRAPKKPSGNPPVSRFPRENDRFPEISTGCGLDIHLPNHRHRPRSKPSDPATTSESDPDPIRILRTYVRTDVRRTPHPTARIVNVANAREKDPKENPIWSQP